MRKNNFLLILTLFTIIFMAASPAHAGYLYDYFFPSNTKAQDENVARTLQAPFADGPKVVAPTDGSQVKTALPENSVSIDQPHRTSEEISEWLQHVISETMTFDMGDYQATMNETVPYFDEGGRQMYTQFLTDSGITKVLDSKRYNVRGFVRELPVLLNEGAIDGHYRWLYDVPVMVSYMDSSMKDYKSAKPVSHTILLTIQVGRSPGTTNESGVVIERWSGKVMQDVVGAGKKK